MVQKVPGKCALIRFHTTFLLQAAPHSQFKVCSLHDALTTSTSTNLSLLPSEDARKGPEIIGTEETFLGQMECPCPFECRFEATFTGAADGEVDEQVHH